MRAVVSAWRSGLPSPVPIADKSKRARYLSQIGWLGEAAKPIFFADPCEDYEDRDHGEGPEGLAVYEHPEAMLLSDPELWHPVEMFRLGFGRERLECDWESKSNFEHESLEICRAVSARADKAEIKRGKDRGKG